MAKHKKKHKKAGLLSRLTFRTKVIIAIVAAIAVIAGITATVAYIAHRAANESGDFTVTDEQDAQRRDRVRQAQRDAALRRSASDALENGDANKANEVYAEAIKSEDDTARKVQLSIEQSRLLYSAGKTGEAIKVAKEAEALTDDKFLISDWLGRLYEDQKQYALAAQYYDAAGKSVNSPNNMYQFDKKHYDDLIARVNAMGKR